jgi:hypothetical protein
MFPPCPKHLAGVVIINLVDGVCQYEFLNLTPFNPPLLRGEREKKERGAKPLLDTPFNSVLSFAPS